MKHLLLLIIPFMIGCYGSPVHSTFAYNEVQKTVKKNNKALLSINIGLSKEQVLDLMGEPERSEGYAWGSSWLYRTAMTSGVYGTADSDFTPVMFDNSNRLLGWGRNFYEEKVKKYELEIK